MFGSVASLRTLDLFTGVLGEIRWWKKGGEAGSEVDGCYGLCLKTPTLFQAYFS